MPNFRARGPGGQFIAAVARTELTVRQLNRVLQQLTEGANQAAQAVTPDASGGVGGAAGAEGKKGKPFATGLAVAGAALGFAKIITNAAERAAEGMHKLALAGEESSARIARATTDQEALANFERATAAAAEQAFQDRNRNASQYLEDVFVKISGGVDAVQERQLAADLDVKQARMKMDELVAKRRLRAGVGMGSFSDVNARMMRGLTVAEL